MGITDARNKRILALVEQKRLSYELIAGMVGCTRNAVAGVAFRARHPKTTLVKSPNCGTRGRKAGNKTGKGYRFRSYEPELTAANTR